MINIRDVLRSVAPVLTALGDRIYPDVLPQKPTLPALVYQAYDGDDPVSHDGKHGLQMEVFQLDVYAETWLEARQIMEKINVGLNGYSASNVQGIFLVRYNPVGYDVDTKLYRRSADFRTLTKES